MASAILASHNESSWAHMGKAPFSNPHLNSDPSSNPKKKQKQFHHAAANGVSGRYHIHNNNVDSPAVTQTAFDDAYSFNQTSTTRNAPSYGSHITYDVASYTKNEVLELRKRLNAERDRIRDLRGRIESGQFNIPERSRSQAKQMKFTGSKRPGVLVGSVPKKLYANGVPEAFNFEDLLKECSKVAAKLIKHKHGFIFKAPVDAVALGLHDYHSIVKRPMDLGTVKSNLTKNLYRTPTEFAADMRLTFNNALLYNPKSDPVNRMAEQLLARFEELFKPIQLKIDDVLNQRHGRELHEFRVDNELHFREVEEVQGSSWNNQANQINASPVRGKKSKSRASPVPLAQVLKKSERMQTPTQAHSTASTPSHMPLAVDPKPEHWHPSPVRAPSLTTKEQKVGRSVTLKQPKPKAKDPNKRKMSMDEKQKLGIGLQSLPQEKMPQLVQIIRKRNEHLAQDGDEIELDIEALDTETLWELDRFVTNWKKMVSKTKRQAMMMNNIPAAAGVDVSTSPAEADVGIMSDKNDDPGKKLKDNEDEDVDIDDDMPAESYPPVEIEKDENLGVEIEKDEGVGGGDGGVAVDQDNDHDDRGNASSSSSSSGSSSSDSSSSSGSSSGSDSDADDAQS